MSWEHIDSAPKDGTIIDVLSIDGERFTDVHWNADKQDWLHWWLDSWGAPGWCRVDVRLAHWMPLPANPLTTQEQARG